MKIYLTKFKRNSLKSSILKSLTVGSALFVGQSAMAALPAGWVSQDVGAVGAPGSAALRIDGKITIKGSGYDIGHNVDAFHYLYTTLQADGEVTAFIDGVSEPEPSDWTKVGVMIRGDLEANAENYTFVLRPKYGSQSQYRPSKNYGSSIGSETAWNENPDPNDYFFGTKHHINYVDKYPTPYRARNLRPGKWLKAVRLGNSVYSYSSDDGKCWNLRARNDNASFGQQTYAGFVLSSHVANQLATATVSNISKNETPQANINWDCARAKVDGDIAAPTNWVVVPGVFGGGSWSLSYTNPNPAQRPATCRSRMKSFERRFTDDATYCPAEVTQAAWTRPNYTFNTGSWQTQPGGFGEKGVGRAAYTRTPFNKKEFWLRKEVQLTSTDFNKIVFWGRWNNSASIYINGVLATNVYDNWMKDAYHYLGVRDEARAALINGTNVITAHIECTNCDSAFADFGLARHDKLGRFYQRNQMTDPTSPNYNPSYNANTKTAKLAKVFTDYVKEKALLGGSVAVRKAGVLVESQTIGYRDATLANNMPNEPILRLASVDKAPTRAAIRKLIEQGASFTKDPTYTGPFPITATTKVFGPGGILSDINPVGGQWGTNVQDITIAHLHDHTSGINDNGRDDQAYQDEAALKYGIPAAQMTIKNLIGIWISQPTVVVPGAVEPGKQYSSGGHAVLRFIVERVSGKSITNFFKENLNAPDFTVAYERMENRKLDPNNPSHRETGYGLIGKETRSRWYELEEYRALSASAEGLTKFFYDNDLGNKDYALVDAGKPVGQRRFVGPNGGGAMDGSHSGSVIEDLDGVKHSYAYIWNSDKPPSQRFEIKRTLALYSDLQPGTCNPTDTSIVQGQDFRIDSVFKKNWYLHTGHQDSTNPAFSTGLKFTAVGPDDTVFGYSGVNWKIERRTGANNVTYYVVRNTLKNKVLGVTNSAVVLKDLAATPAADTMWYLRDSTASIPVGNANVSSTAFRLENGWVPGTGVKQFLTVDSANGIRVAADNGSNSFKWYICN